MSIKSNYLCHLFKPMISSQPLSSHSCGCCVSVLSCPFHAPPTTTTLAQSFHITCESATMVAGHAVTLFQLGVVKKIISCVVYCLQLTECCFEIDLRRKLAERAESHSRWNCTDELHNKHQPRSVMAIVWCWQCSAHLAVPMQFRFISEIPHLWIVSVSAQMLLLQVKAPCSRMGSLSIHPFSTHNWCAHHWGFLQLCCIFHQPLEAHKSSNICVSNTTSGTFPIFGQSWKFSSHSVSVFPGLMVQFEFCPSQLWHFQLSDWWETGQPMLLWIAISQKSWKWKCATKQWVWSAITGWIIDCLLKIWFPLVDCDLIVTLVKKSVFGSTCCHKRWSSVTAGLHVMLCLQIWVCPIHAQSFLEIFCAKEITVGMLQQPVGWWTLSMSDADKCCSWTMCFGQKSSTFKNSASWGLNAFGFCS